MPGLVILAEGNAVADISTFTSMGTSVLTWLVTTWGTIINFMLTHPICFIGLALWLIVAAIGIVRKIIGG